MSRPAPFPLSLPLSEIPLSLVPSCFCCSFWRPSHDSPPSFLVLFGLGSTRSAGGVNNNTQHHHHQQQRQQRTEPSGWRQGAVPEELRSLRAAEARVRREKPVPPLSPTVRAAPSDCTQIDVCTFAFLVLAGRSSLESKTPALVARAWETSTDGSWQFNSHQHMLYFMVP